MSGNFFNYKRGDVKNQKTGYRNRAFMALISEMTTVAEPAANATGAAAKTVTTDHVFTAGKGFIEVYVLPKSLNAPGESVGVPGALNVTYKPQFFIPGDTAELQALTEDGLLNADLVLLVEDANCPDGGLRQFGCECTPLTVTSAKFESENRKGWLIESETDCRFFYNGVVTKLA